MLALLSCLALLASGCAGVDPGTARYTCGQMRADGSKYRRQARYMVAQERLRARTLWQEQAVLDAELQIRRTCRGASDGSRPYLAVVAALSPRSVLDAVAGG